MYLQQIQATMFEKVTMNIPHLYSVISKIAQQ